MKLSDGELRAAVTVDLLGGGGNCVFTEDGVDKAFLPTEALFFEFDNLEHCLKIRRRGLLLLADSDAMLAARKRAGILGIRSYPGRASWRAQSLWRTCYLVRNYIYLMTRVFEKPRLAYLQTIAGTRYQLRGIADGFAGKMGRRVSPELVNGVYPRRGTY